VLDAIKLTASPHENKNFVSSVLKGSFPPALAPGNKRGSKGRRHPHPSCWRRKPAAMPREIITLQVGQCGNQSTLGGVLWLLGWARASRRGRRCGGG